MVAERSITTSGAATNCPGCGDDQRQYQLANVADSNDRVYRCGKCERLYIVPAGRATEVVSRLNEMIATAEELGRKHDRLVVRAAEVQALLEVAREQLDSVVDRIRLAMIQA